MRAETDENCSPMHLNSSMLMNIAIESILETLVLWFRSAKLLQNRKCLQRFPCWYFTGKLKDYINKNKWHIVS